MSKMFKNKTGWLILGAVVGMGLIWLFAVSGETPTEAETPTDETAGTEHAASTRTWNDTVEVRNQDAGMTVVVSRVSVAEDAWLVVHEQWPSGARGNALGAALVFTTTESAVVELLRGTTAGNRYEVLIYSDDGDRQFDLKKDTLRMQAGGTPISATFFALATEASGASE